MTLLIVAMLGDRTKQEWYQWVKQRVENKVGYDTPENVPPVFRTHLQQDAQQQSLFGGSNAAQRNVALSLNGLGSGGLLSAIPRVLSGQGASEEEIDQASEDAAAAIVASNDESVEKASSKNEQA